MAFWSLFSSIGDKIDESAQNTVSWTTSRSESKPFSPNTLIFFGIFFSSLVGWLNWALRFHMVLPPDPISCVWGCSDGECNCIEASNFAGCDFLGGNCSSALYNDFAHQSTPPWSLWW
jgi:hypothetical protein